MSRAAVRVYLVPGFFGFTRAGALSYFQGVAPALGDALARRGIEAEIVTCRTQPTASIRRRAERLASVVQATGGLEADELHFVGHSTGGLDVRLLLTPGVRLRSDRLEERVVARARTAVSVSTPHFGTPLAGFFTTLPGRQVLEALALLATSYGGRLGLVAVAQVLGLAARLDDLLGLRQTFLDFLARDLLARVTHERDAALWSYLREVASDQGAIIQLTPESMHLFNAAVVDTPAVRYASLVTAAPPPPSRYRVTDLLSALRASLAGAFTLLHALTAREHRHYPYPRPHDEALEPFEAKVPFPLTESSNDGIVPVFSQIYGDVIDVLVADHLDVVGQYARADDPHADWLPSGSRFGPAGFATAWDGVAEAIAGASDAAGPAR